MKTPRLSKADRAALEVIARRVIRSLRPSVPPTSFEVRYVCGELLSYKKGQIAVLALLPPPRAPKAKGLDPATRAQLQAVVNKRKRKATGARYSHGGVGRR